MAFAILSAGGCIIDATQKRSFVPKQTSRILRFAVNSTRHSRARRNCAIMSSLEGQSYYVAHLIYLTEKCSCCMSFKVRDFTQSRVYSEADSTL